jgi:hypothetical protein
MLPTKGLFDMGDIAALVDPTCVRWEKVKAPAVNYGEIVRRYHIENEPAFQLLGEALRQIENSETKQEESKPTCYRFRPPSLVNQ